ncbi:MAG: sigma-70 family RNA polymerase sigma factor [Chitinophagaceae bacterium]|nr:sigma-70 family RNA polymerase sigma factor [Chitinophagaceae bacterium]
MDIITEIYSRFSKKIRSFIMQHGGTSADAADIFGEVLTALYLQSKYKNLKLVTSFESVFVPLCRRRWVQKSGIRPAVQMEPSKQTPEEEMVTRIENETVQSEILFQTLKKMEDPCKEIIETVLSGGDQQLLAVKLRISADYLKQKKADCLIRLINTSGIRI